MIHPESETGQFLMRKAEEMAQELYMLERRYHMDLVSWEGLPYHARQKQIDRAYIRLSFAHEVSIR